MAPQQDQQDENEVVNPRPAVNGSANNAADNAATAAAAAPQQEEEEDNEMSLEELLYSTASFHAIVKPGTWILGVLDLPLLVFLHVAFSVTSLTPRSHSSPQSH